MEPAFLVGLHWVCAHTILQRLQSLYMTSSRHNELMLIRQLISFLWYNMCEPAVFPFFQSQEYKDPHSLFIIKENFIIKNSRSYFPTGEVTSMQSTT